MSDHGFMNKLYGAISAYFDDPEFTREGKAYRVEITVMPASGDICWEPVDTEFKTPVLGFDEAAVAKAEDILFDKVSQYADLCEEASEVMRIRVDSLRQWIEEREAERKPEDASDATSRPPPNCSNDPERERRSNYG